MLCALCVGQASALEYTMEAPDDYLFGRPTSDDTIYEWEDPNVDRSKNTALIPPGFGTPTSYLPGSGDPLTPNLIPGSTQEMGAVLARTSAIPPSPAISTTPTDTWGHSRSRLSACLPRSTKGQTAALWQKGPVISLALVSGTATAVLRVTTAVSGMILETCIPWSQGTRSPGPPSWAHGPIR